MVAVVLRPVARRACRILHLNCESLRIPVLCRQLNTLTARYADSSEGVESNQTQSFAAQQKQVRSQTAAIFRANEETIHLLVRASSHRDSETGNHIKRVGLRSARLAAVFGLEHREMDLIRLVARCTTCSKSVSWTAC